MAVPNRKQASKRQALFVLGMHRSGTSAVGGVLAGLGVQAPKTLMPPTEDNPRGYLESVALMGAHDQILASAGSRWNDWGPFNPGWIDSVVAGQFRDSLAPLIESEFGRSPLFLVKDPRICRFLPLWLQALNEQKITPKIVIPLRHPLEVARSLELRDDFGRNRSLLMWLRHVLDAEASSRGVERSLVRYDHLLDDWQSQAAKMSKDLALKWPKWSADTEAAIAAFLSPELRHHVAKGEFVPGAGELSEWANQAYKAMLVLEERPNDQHAMATLDQIRGDFDRTSSIYAAVVREHEIKSDAHCAATDVQSKEYGQQKAAAEAALAVAEQRGTQLDERLFAFEETLAARESELAEVNQQYASDKAFLLNRVNELQHLVKGLEEKSAAVAEGVEHRHAQYLDLQSQSEQEVAALNAALGSQEAILATLAAQLAASNSALADRDAELAASISALADRDAELADLAAQLDSSRAEQDMLKQVEQSHHEELERLTTQLQSRDWSLAALNKKHDELHRLVSLQEEQLADAAKAIESVELSLSTRFEETAKLSSMVLELERAIADKTRAETARETKLLEFSANIEHLSDELTASNIVRDALERAHARKLAQAEHQLAAQMLSHDALLHQSERWRTDAVEYREALRNIKNSKIWKFTAPIHSDLAVPDPVSLPLDDGFDYQVELLKGSSLFDGEWYANEYPQVAQSDLDPVVHYLRSGVAEGLNPGPGFDTLGYLVQYPDVRRSGMNPLFHYLEHGRKEDRTAIAQDDGGER